MLFDCASLAGCAPYQDPIKQASLTTIEDTKCPISQKQSRILHHALKTAGSFRRQAPDLAYWTLKLDVA